MKQINVLIVDDHPFIIQAYRNALAKFSERGFEFSITQANNCQTGYEAIIEQSQPFDLAMFDISMPAYDEKEIFSGLDLAKVMNTTMPNCKIIMLTMHAELLKLENIVKEVDPHALIFKNDLTFDELLGAFDKVLNDEYYYSETVSKNIDVSE